MPEINFESLMLVPELVIAVVVIVANLLMFLIKRIFLRKFSSFTDRTTHFYDSLLAHSLNVPLTILIFVIDIWMLNWLLDKYDISNESYATSISMSSKILLITAAILFLNRFAVGLLANHTQRSDSLRSSTGIIKGIVKGLIIGIGILIMLGTLGISITPIIASLGITSLAVALALQPTLENFFSGVQLVMDKPIRVGDFIELESKEQGFVERIGWRSTWIKMLPNNTIIVPNSVLSESKIINYFYPSKELSVPVDVGVHYNSDLEHVERVTLEVAREILVSHKWGIDDYDTFVVYHTFDNSSINFTVMLRAQEYFHRFFIKSAFIKALHQRYAAEGIIIPYPIRAINTDQESAIVDVRNTIPPANQGTGNDSN
ncbi:mechanosensitive ion channel [Alteromonas sp. 1_MG-2023]|uniref:mechanosensitive ion channel family protein n=1 Tax=Alteromonas sp. 1_MG-2023 TaxID=3062669 RepID=UPI0026E2492F|nr:mechanosensitive ion channel domain-containing protein [Alteromonas sp. 1_MG-2023]MDO6569186.1 mechanosensitive ion channel [Alteromonas sp. 1_MG-2023]